MTSQEALRPQRRGRSPALTAPELDDLLLAERTGRPATIGADGSPHVAPLWFVWHEGAVWLWSLVRSQRWADLARDPRASFVVDAGEEFTSLRVAELRGTVTPVGEAPRSSAPHAVLTPTKVTSWNHRKLRS